MTQETVTEPGVKPVERASLFSRQRPLQSPNEALQPVAPPPPPGKPPSQRRPMLSAFSGFLSFLLIAAGFGVAALAWMQQHLTAPGPLQSDKVVYIARGTEDIIGQLESEGVISNTFLLNFALTLEGNRSKVRAGEIGRAHV